MKRRHVRLWITSFALLAIGVGAVIAMNRPHVAAQAGAIPLAQVTRGDIDLQVHSFGELTASHVAMVIAPPIGGDSLQITQLAKTGELVKQGDVIVEFDPSEQHYKLEQNRSELQQAEQEIVKAKADAAVLAAQDKVALLKAKYGVRSAELDVQKNELLSKIDADKNDLALRQAKRVLAELQKDIESHRAAGQAAVFLAQEKYNKAKLAMDQAQQNLDHMHVTAPMSGLVSIQKNVMASGGFFFSGMSLPDFRAGDQVNPGAAIAQVLDPAGMNLTSKVPESQHDNIKQGEPVEVRFDALPGKVFKGAVKTVGGMSMHAFFDDSGNGGSFDVTIQIAGTDPNLRPGLSAEITFLGGRKPNVLYIPRQALFMKDGKRIVYVSSNGSYQQREVKVQCETESRAAIEGVEAGAQVALIDPTVPHKHSSSASAGAEGAL